MPSPEAKSKQSRIDCAPKRRGHPKPGSHPGPARRTIDRLSEKIAVAVLDFMLGPLLKDLQRVGKALRGELAGLYSALVGAYRVVYEISEADTTVRVVYIDHRADVYRPR